jgi:hypothetical protein
LVEIQRVVQQSKSPRIGGFRGPTQDVGARFWL